jgi:hypothetical protein
VLVASIGLSVSLLLAVMADRVDAWRRGLQVRC